MLAEDYAHALYELVEAGSEPKVLFVRLDGVLKENGHQKLKPQIVRALERLTERKSSSSIPLVTVADESHASKLNAQIQAALSELRAPTEYDITIDETVTGGYRVSYDGKQIDNTLKSKLLTLYKNITH